MRRVEQVTVEFGSLEGPTGTCYVVARVYFEKQINTWGKIRAVASVLRRVGSAQASRTCASADRLA